MIKLNETCPCGASIHIEDDDLARAELSQANWLTRHEGHSKPEPERQGAYSTATVAGPMARQDPWGPNITPMAAIPFGFVANEINAGGNR